MELSLKTAESTLEEKSRRARLQVERQSAEFDASTTLRLSNLTAFLRATHKNYQIVGSEFGPGLRLRVSATPVPLGQATINKLNVHLIPPKTQLGNLPLHVTYTIETISGSVLASKTVKLNITPGEIAGERALLSESICDLEVVKRDDAIDLIVRVKSLRQSAETNTQRLERRTASFIGHTLMNARDARDTKFLLYKSAPTGSDQKPKLGVVYADSYVLEQAYPKFMSSLGEEVAFLDANVMPPFDANYDYYSDSDLENDDDAGGDDGEEGNIRENLKLPTSSNSTVQDEQNSKNISGSQSKTGKSEVMDIDVHEVADNNCIVEGDTGNNDLLAHQEKTYQIIRIPGIAHKTWLAVIFYLYTGAINFAPLSSDPIADYHGANWSYLDNFPDCPSLVSCKSIYRAAKKLGLRGLEDRAAAHLKSQLNIHNIIHEVFSSFTSRYDLIQEIESEFLFANASKLPDMDSLTRKMQEVAAGQLPHSAWLLSKMVARLK